MTNANIENELGLMKCLFCDNQFVLTRGKTLPRCNATPCVNKYIQLQRHFYKKFVAHKPNFINNVLDDLKQQLTKDKEKLTELQEDTIREILKQKLKELK